VISWDAQFFIDCIRQITANCSNPYDKPQSAHAVNPREEYLILTQIRFNSISSIVSVGGSSGQGKELDTLIPSALPSQAEWT
jgi:hypothetical protein